MCLVLTVIDIFLIVFLERLLDALLKYGRDRVKL
jgi:hypothetical protein